MAAAAIAGLLLAGAAGGIARAAEPEVKKSQSGVCHAPDSVHYERTRKFTPYDSLEDCLASGGRESQVARKRPWRGVIAGTAMIVLIIVGCVLMRRHPWTPGQSTEEPWV